MNKRISMMIILICVVAVFGCQKAVESAKDEGLAKPNEDPIVQAKGDPKAILEKALDAHGGQASFTQWKCGIIKYEDTGGIKLAGAEDTVEDTFQLPGHFKRIGRIKMADFEETEILVINNGKGWKKRNTEEAQFFKNDITTMSAHPFGTMLNLLPVTDVDVRLMMLADAKHEGRILQGIRATSEKIDGGQIDLYFDKDTSLLAKKKVLTTAKFKKGGTIESFFNNYKEINGGKVPMSISSYQNGRIILFVNILDLRFMDKIEPSAFAKP